MQWRRPSARAAGRQSGERETEADVATVPEPPQAAGILDSYVLTEPSAQNAVDIFEGEWSSVLPAPLSDVTAGAIPLFSDQRVTWAVEQFGGLAGKSVLELGPLEGGHSYMLGSAGAQVTAIESQIHAYLRCLIVKELLPMTTVRFMLGDFMEYLRNEPEHVDVCFASGVLYHMRSPAETIELMAKVADRLFLWTHVYDEQTVRNSDLLSPRFTDSVRTSHEGFEHTLHRFEYAYALDSNAFCGGSAVYSNWLSRNDLLAGLEWFGWSVDAIAFEAPDHEHGPALGLVASKRR
jgi:Protein of unknown function (DUF1698)